MKYQFEILAEVKCFEMNMVTIEANSYEDAKNKMENWKHYYSELSHIEILMETLEDTGYYEIREETLQEIDDERFN